MRPQPIKPSPGQESVWDYPRPPRLEPTDKHIQIIFSGWPTGDIVGPFKDEPGTMGW